MSRIEFADERVSGEAIVVCPVARRVQIVQKGTPAGLVQVGLAEGFMPIGVLERTERTGRHPFPAVLALRAILRKLTRRPILPMIQLCLNK